MDRLTIRVPEDLREEIERIEDADDVSQSEAARRLLRRGTAYDGLKAERDRLQRKLEATNARNDDVDEIVEYVQEERELQRRREERRDAPLWTRAKWYVLGRSRDGADA